MQRFGILAVVAAAGLATVGIAPAQAAFQVRITQGANTLTVTDNGAGDTNANANAIAVNAATLQTSFTGLDVGSQVAATTNFASADLFRSLNVTSILVRDNTGATQTFKIEASRDSFVVPPDNSKTVNSSVSTTFTNASSDNVVNFNGGVDPANAMFVIAVSPGTIGPIASVNQAFVNNGTPPGGFTFPTPFSDMNPYSISSISTITILANANIQVQSAVFVQAGPSAVVPAPAGLVLLAAAAPLLGLRRVLRRKTA